MLTINEFTDFSALSSALSQQWLGLIQSAPADQVCSFALAGGTTPEPLYRQFDHLFAESKKGRIQLIATDERWVSDANGQSNEGLFRQCFAGSAGQWKLVSLKNEQANPTLAVPEINARIKETCPLPFTAIILGMGSDGHIASLFPNAAHLLVDEADSDCVAAYHPQNLQARMSLSFGRLLKTNAIWLVITGAEKRAVLEGAKPNSPIGALLAAARCNVEVFWCP